MTVEYIATHTTEDNVEVDLYVNNAGQFTVRVYDVDAAQAVGFRSFVDLERAQAHYNSLIEEM